MKGDRAKQTAFTFVISRALSVPRSPTLLHQSIAASCFGCILDNILQDLGRLESMVLLNCTLLSGIYETHSHEDITPSIVKMTSIENSGLADPENPIHCDHHQRSLGEKRSEKSDPYLQKCCACRVGMDSIVFLAKLAA